VKTAGCSAVKSLVKRGEPNMPLWIIV